MTEVVAEEGPLAMNIATISAGFEKGDFLVREEQGNRVYFDFFEEVRLWTFHQCHTPRYDVQDRTATEDFHIQFRLFSHRLYLVYVRHSTTSRTRDMPVCPARMKSIGLIS